MKYAFQANPFTGENDYEALSESTYNTEEDLSAPDLVDFSPVYRFYHRCVHLRKSSFHFTW